MSCFNKKLLLVLTPILFGIVSLQAEDLQVKTLQQLDYLTENFPPYNFEADGKLQGIAVELLQEALIQLKQPVNLQDIKPLPWVRAYKMTLAGPNKVLFSIARTEAREELFKWVGPLGQIKIVLLAMHSQNIKISEPSDITKYTIGAIKDDAGEQLVKALGIKKNKLVSLSNTNSLIKMLANNRIQLWAYEESAARWHIKNSKLTNSAFESVYTFEVNDLYYAFSKDVDSVLIQQLQKGFDKLKNSTGKTGITIYDEIKQRYQ